MINDYLTQTIAAYDASAEQYELATANATPNEELVNLIAALPAGNLPILDAGCAFGRDTAKFAKHNQKVLGIDLSAGLLKRAKELHPELAFENMDIRKLKLDDESINGIWCHATLLHLNNGDIQASLAEFSRVLIPGGSVFMSFKEGSGEEQFVSTFGSDNVWYFNYQTIESTTFLVESSGLAITSSYVVHEIERWGPSKRRLNWIYCFAKKT